MFLDIGAGGVRDWRYRLIPVFSILIDADPEMTALIERIRAPHAGRLGEELAVAGWATVNARSPGPPIWEVVAQYLRDRGSARIARLNTPKLVNVEGNPGIADDGA